jgi:hypothetical protein
VTTTVRGIEFWTTVRDLQAPDAEDEVQDGFRDNAAANRLMSGS